MNRMWQRVDLLDRFVAPHRQRTAVDGLAAHDLVERCAERIAAEHADHERRAAVGKRGRRPVDELREVEQEHRLHLVLARCGRRRLRASGRCRSERQQRCDNRGRVSAASELPCHLSVDAALDFAARGRRAELDVMIVQQVLTDERQLPAARSPATRGARRAPSKRRCPAPRRFPAAARAPSNGGTARRVAVRPADRAASAD